MREKLEQFRAAAKDVRNGRGRKFPKALMTLGAEYARARRDTGGSWQEIAGELGVVIPTVQRWAQGRPPGFEGFHAVTLAERSPRGHCVAVLPGGIRVEGLAIEELVALARALS